MVECLWGGVLLERWCVGGVVVCCGVVGCCWSGGLNGWLCVVVVVCFWGGVLLGWCVVEVVCC